MLRGGAGLYYKNISGVGWYWPTVGLPGAISGSWSSPDSGITPAFVLQNGYPVAPPPPTDYPGPGYGAVPVGQNPQLGFTYADIPEYRQSYSQQFTLAIERELPGSMLATVQYLGNLSRHLVGPNRADNQVVPALFGPGNAQIRRPFPQYGSVGCTLCSEGNSSYHALQAKLEKRLSQGLSFNFDWLFNKYLSDWIYPNRYDRSAGKSIQGPQQKLIAYAIYDLPWGERRRWLNSGPMSKVVGGWVVTPVLRLTAGTPGTVSYISDTTNGFIQGNQGVDLVGNPNSGPRTMAQWFNTAAFAPPASYKMGNAGWTIVDTPGTIGYDMAIHRLAYITERVTVDFRVEMFNTFNHSNLGGPGLTLGSPTFGVITGKSGNRRIQFGLRGTF